MSNATVWRESFDPNEVKEYYAEFGDLLDEVTDAIDTASWALGDAATNGLVESSSAVLDNKRTCVIWLDCTDGQEDTLKGGSPYELTCTVVTFGGRTFQRSFELTVEEL
jgi:hypothetical protein